MDVEPKIGGKHAPQNGWLKKKMEEKPIKTGCFGGFPHIFGSTPGYVGFIPQEHPVVKVGRLEYWMGIDLMPNVETHTKSEGGKGIYRNLTGELNRYLKHNRKSLLS